MSTCTGNYHPLSGHTDPATATSLRPCNLDSNIDGWRNIRENLVNLGDGVTEYIDNDVPVYAGGYRGNRHSTFYNPSTFGTGLTKLNYGYGTNFYSTSPYWYATRPRTHTHTHTLTCATTLPLVCVCGRMLTGVNATRKTPTQGTKNAPTTPRSRREAPN